MLSGGAEPVSKFATSVLRLATLKTYGALGRWITIGVFGSCARALWSQAVALSVVKIEAETT
jgi:hypothetical protein